MAPRKKPSMSSLLDNQDVVRLIRDVSSLSESMERGREDRAEMKEFLQKMESSIDGLRNSVNALNQTMSSTSTAVAQIALEKCGERLSALEALIKEPNISALANRLRKMEEDIKESKTTIDRWRRWIGEGWSFIGRVLVAVAASGLLGGTVFGLAAKVLERL